VELKNEEMITSPNSKVMINNNYIPKSNRPKWCRNNNKEFIPQFRCMCFGKNNIRCPFFSFTNADKKDYKIFNKVWLEVINANA